ncbi:MAG: S-methyl-5'-thioinosine phosphorylase [Pseudomonadota bacterium]
MQDIAIIGGTGLASFPGLKITNKEVVRTPFGIPSGPITYGEYCGKKIIFLPRHGAHHTIPPHMVNYRANIWALHDKDVKQVVAVAAVGGINAEIYPTRIVIPDQIIDYTYGRAQTYYEKDLNQVKHIDFTNPYDEVLRQNLIKAGKLAEIDIYKEGVYAATQGPRLETAAEIKKLEKDGCDIVGMTGMPEAALARELDIAYAHCTMSVNWAAGRSEELITLEAIRECTEAGMEKVRHLLAKLMELV